MQLSKVWSTLLFQKTNGQQIMLYFVGINATGMFKYLTQHCYKHVVVVMHVLYPKKHAYLSPQFLHIICFFFPLLQDLKYCSDTPKNNLNNLFSIYLFVVLFAKFLIRPKGILWLNFVTPNDEVKLSYGVVMHLLCIYQ